MSEVCVDATVRRRVLWCLVLQTSANRRTQLVRHPLDNSGVPRRRTQKKVGDSLIAIFDWHRTVAEESCIGSDFLGGGGRDRGATSS